MAGAIGLEQVAQEYDRHRGDWQRKQYSKETVQLGPRHDSKDDRNRMQADTLPHKAWSQYRTLE